PGKMVVGPGILRLSCYIVFEGFQDSSLSLGCRLIKLAEQEVSWLFARGQANRFEQRAGSRLVLALQVSSCPQAQAHLPGFREGSNSLDKPPICGWLFLRQQLVCVVEAISLIGRLKVSGLPVSR